MKKKALVIAGVAALALMVAGVTMASPMSRAMMGGGHGMGGDAKGMQSVKLSDSQQSEWKAWQEKNFKLKKEQVQLMVKSGYYTQEQADAKLKMMDRTNAFRMKNNLVSPGARLTPPLTDEQKADMKNMAEQRLVIQKENIARMVAAGKITQLQADAKIERMQKRIDENIEKGFTGRKGGSREGFKRGGHDRGMGNCPPLQK